jgi:hypothetical protein
LNEIKSSVFGIPLHNKDRQIRLREFDATIQHPNENGWVILEVDHKLLGVLYGREAWGVGYVEVGEEEVGIGGELEAEGLEGVVIALNEREGRESVSFERREPRRRGEDILPGLGLCI